MTETRIRKAWACRLKGHEDQPDTFYAETGSKARYQALLEWRDPLPDISFTDILVSRNTHRDICLPPPHRLVADLSPVERRMIEHAYGSHSRSPGYRDHYCADPSTTPLLRLTFELGLFDGPHSQGDEYGETPPWSGSFFHLTSLGREVARSMLPTYPQ